MEKETLKMQILGTLLAQSVHNDSWFQDCEFKPHDAAELTLK